MKLNVVLGLAIIVLAFPILESVGIYHVWQIIGVWTLAWLALGILLGWSLMLHVQKGWSLQLMGALQSGVSPWHALTTVGLRFFAGLLFIIPGLVSDAIGLMLLLAAFILPAPAPQSRDGFGGVRGTQTTNPEVIDGEWRRVDDPALSHHFTHNREPPDSVK